MSDRATVAGSSGGDSAASMSRRTSPFVKSEHRLNSSIPEPGVRTLSVGQSSLSLSSKTVPDLCCKDSVNGNEQLKHNASERMTKQRRKYAATGASVAFAAEKFAVHRREFESDKNSQISAIGTGKTTTTQLCWGYGILTPDFFLFALTLTGIFIMNGTIVRVLLKTVMFLTHTQFISVVACWGVVVFWTLSALLRTAFMDPGVVPRGKNAGTIITRL